MEQIKKLSNTSLLACVSNSFLLAVAILFGGLYLELFHETVAIFYDQNAVGLITGYVSVVIVARTILYSFALLAIYMLTKRVPSGFFDTLFKYRYVVGISLFAILVLTEVSLSSIGMWGFQLPGGTTDGLIFGIPRSVRSDEFNAATLWNLSQEFNNYAPMSEILRGDLTDTRLVYNTASFSLITAFRPFLWGYLLFGSAKGVAFFTMGKLFATFFASFECFRVMSRDDRKASLVFSILITFSPMVLWWSMWEGLIYGQLLVVFLSKFLTADRQSSSILYGALIAWFCGCYVMIIYPAWMVPFFYLFAIMGLTVVARFVRAGEFHSKKIIRFKAAVLICLLFLAGISIALSLLSSMDVIQATSQTVYPGARFETGGSVGKELFNYVNSLIFPLAQPGFSNSSELSSMFSLFPVGTTLALILITRYKTTSVLPFLGYQAFLLLYVTAGIPGFLSRITLFSNCPAGRVLFAVGYLEIFILMYSLSQYSYCRDQHRTCSISPYFVLCLSIVLTLLLVVCGSIAIPGYERMLFVLLTGAALLAFILPVLMIASGAAPSATCMKSLVWVSMCVVMVPGLCVHPIQRGIGPISQSEFAQDVSSIVQSNPSAKWVSEGNWTTSNLLTALGARTVFATNAYPDMNIWSSLDPSGEYEEIYNRYAHIDLHIVNTETSFELLGVDLIRVNLSVSDLNELDIDYIATTNVWEDGLFDPGSVELISNNSGLLIYRVL